MRPGILLHNTISTLIGSSNQLSVATTVLNLAQLSKGSKEVRDRLMPVKDIISHSDLRVARLDHRYINHFDWNAAVTQHGPTSVLMKRPWRFMLKVAYAYVSTYDSHCVTISRIALFGVVRTTPFVQNQHVCHNRPLSGILVAQQAQPGLVSFTLMVVTA
jgi:hypothetical protein